MFHIYFPQHLSAGDESSNLWDREYRRPCLTRLTWLLCITSAFRIFFIPVYKSSLFSQYPTYMRNMFAILHTTYNRSSHLLSLSKTRTTIDGLHSFSYFSAKQWNAFPEELTKSIFPDFKQRVQSLNMFDYSFSNFSLVLCIYLFNIYLVSTC